MVLVSIFVLAYSNDPNFIREMTNCERLEYIDSTGIEGYDFIKPYLEELCLLGDVPEFSQSLIKKLNMTDVADVILQEKTNEGDENVKEFIITFIYKQLINLKIDEPPDFTDELEFNNGTNITDTLPSAGNINETELATPPMLKMLEPVPVHKQFIEQQDILVPNIKIKILTLFILEGLTTVFFTIEILLRLSTCPNIKVYFLSLIDSADALSLLGSYLYFFLYLTYPNLRYDSWINYLAYLQALRSFRFFRLILCMRAGIVLAYSLRRNIKDLFILVLFVFAGMCTFGTCIYIAEENETFQSIPDAWYLSVITMTTVGYGDIHPQTNIGRFFCCLCAVAGILLLALTVPMFANHFLVLYNHIETENVVKKYRERKIKQFHDKESGDKLQKKQKATY